MTTTIDLRRPLAEAKLDAEEQGLTQYVATTPDGRIASGPAYRMPVGFTLLATVGADGQVTYHRENDHEDR